MDASELKKESEHLEKVKAQIKEIIDEKNVQIEEYKNEVVKEKKFLWNNQNDYKDFEMMAEMNDEDHTVGIINKDIIKVYKLYRSLESPFFCRIDFKADNKTETFYIGLTGVDVDYEPVVYDWRANVANLYYNYDIGAGEYESESGCVKGEITLKRQFTILRGEIKEMYDAVTGIRDAILDSVLKSNTSAQMKNIVNTIGKEQNDIIRKPVSKNMIVEGVAGSGKTSVAMHRIAYLLYNQKGLTNKNVLIFSPSEEFSAYISNVLPELGEENVRTTTFKELSESTFGRKTESLVDISSKFYSGKGKEKILENKYKLTYEYKKKIDEFSNKYYDSLKFTKKIGLKDTFLMASELNRLKASVPKELKFSDKIERLSEKICAKFKIDEIKNAPRFNKIIRKMLGVSSNPIELYELFTGCEVGEEVSYLDSTSALYLHFLVNGYPEVAYIKQVIIDEVQDYTMWQLEMLRTIFKSATFTVLGDANQSINPLFKYDDLSKMTSIFADSTYIKMNKSYRSIKNIVDYSNSLIGACSIAVRSEEKDGLLFKTESDLKLDLAQDLSNLKSRGYERICIIVKTDEEKEKIENFHLEADVKTVYASKGLEYDAVIIYTDKDNPYNKNEANIFYVAATRALHALIVYNQNK